MNWLILVGSPPLLPCCCSKVVQSPEKASRSGFRREDFLFSARNGALFRAQQAVGDDYEIFGKIPVIELISSREDEANRGARKTFEQVADRCFDFILCGKTDLSIVCALELYEHSISARRSRAPADPLRAICDAAGLPLVRIEAGPFYDANEINKPLHRLSARIPVSGRTRRTQGAANFHHRGPRVVSPLKLFSYGIRTATRVKARLARCARREPPIPIFARRPERSVRGHRTRCGLGIPSQPPKHDLARTFR